MGVKEGLGGQKMNRLDISEFIIYSKRRVSPSWVRLDSMVPAGNSIAKAALKYIQVK